MNCSHTPSCPTCPASSVQDQVYLVCLLPSIPTKEEGLYRDWLTACYLDVATGIETIQLVDELQHGSLNLWRNDHEVIIFGGIDSQWCYVTSLSPPAPSSNLAPPTASISSKKMRHAFLVLVKRLNLTQGRKKCFPTWPSQRAHGPSWHLHLHTFAPILTRSPCKTEGCHFTVSRNRLPITWWNLSLIHIWRCRRSTLCRSRWSPYH